jgi:Protein of unknown function (DUF2695)
MNQNEPLEVLTIESPRWDEFAEALERGKWNCQHDHWQAELIMDAMGGVDIPASVAYFESRGGFCDCEILFNVDPIITRHIEPKRT